MLKLKGKTNIFNEVCEFDTNHVVAIDGSTGNWWVEVNHKTKVVEQGTITLAEDPYKILLEKIRSKLRAVMYSEDEEYETYTTEELIEITLGEIESELENN